MVPRQEFRVSRLLYADFLQHLAHDDLDVLVVDINTLEAVYALYFLDHVILYGPKSLDLQDIVRVHATFGQLVAGLQLLRRPGS